MMGLDVHSYDVTIVGYGPVGATLANLLGRGGLKVAVIERDPEIHDRPRATAGDHEMMRTLQFCGLAGQLQERIAPYPGTDFLGVDSQIIKRFYPLAPPYPLHWPPTFSFVQPELETILRAGALRTNNVDVFLNAEAVAIEQDDRSISFRARDRRTGETIAFETMYLIGCDGGNSFTRNAVGIPYDDLAFDESWIVVDTRLTGNATLRPRGTHYCWPSRPSTLVYGVGNLRRWELKLLPHETADDFKSELAVRRELRRFTDESAFEIWRYAVYRFHALIARHWRDRRVLLAGDAAHQMPPFLGQGLCSGMRDAANLAWKLIMVCKGKADEALLDSYETERSPHVRTIIEHAKDFGRTIGELDLDKARSRDQNMVAQLQENGEITIRQSLIPNLDDGVFDPGPERQARGAAGTLFIQPKVAAVVSGHHLLDDLLPPCFVIISRSTEIFSWLTERSQRIWQKLGGLRVALVEDANRKVSFIGSDTTVLVAADDQMSRWLMDNASTAAILRPDRYVYGTAGTEDKLNALVAALEEQVLSASSRESYPAPASIGS